jgi:beta-N-acetylhexosaminidase
MDPIRRAAGRSIMVGLAGAELDSATARRLEAMGVAGVILFARNLVDPAQTAELLAQASNTLAHAPLLAIDQEGGRVSRLEPWIGPTPTAAQLHGMGVDAITRFGIATGNALAGLGFNLDFAPVVDLCPPDAPNGIGARSFSTDPSEVARSAGAFLGGLQSTGVAGCLKHFPGLGDTAVDSHVELPIVTRSQDHLDEQDLLPYRELSARAACVMVGHAHYEALDGPTPCPGTCSRAVVSDWLRGRIGFDGLAVSDDMQMGAVAPRDVAGQAAFDAIDAGMDLLLYCMDLDLADAAIERLTTAGEENPTFAARLQQAAEKVDVISHLWPAPAANLERFEQARDELRRVSA